MKRNNMLLLGFVAVVLVGLLVWQQSSGGATLQPELNREKKELNEPKRKITIDGSGTVKVDPNRARLSLRARTRAETIEKARAENATLLQKVMKAIKGNKIKGLMMKSSDISLSPIYEKDKDGNKLEKVVGYEIDHDFTVLVSNDNRVELGTEAGKVLDSALKNGANAVQAISLFRDDLSEVRRKALTLATADALANAKAIAKGAGQEIVDVTFVDGASRNQPYQIGFGQGGFGHFGMQEAKGISTEFVAGQMQVTCEVQLTCTMSSKK